MEEEHVLQLCVVTDRLCTTELIVKTESQGRGWKQVILKTIVSLEHCNRHCFTLSPESIPLQRKCCMAFQMYVC